jgi:Phage tail assembly chaperone proteins, E, or 41 or 14
MTPRHIIKLAHPFEHDGQAVEQLELRRPKVRDMKKMTSGKGDVMDRMLGLVADLAEITPDAVAEIDTEDFQAVQAWLNPLLGKDDSPNDDAVKAAIREILAGG